jgi:DHA1 family tetracycline resistance protein-like MFS transporter
VGPRLVLFLTVFIHLVGFGIVIPLLPYYAETYGANGAMVGMLVASFSLMQFLFTPMWGRLSDRIGRRPVLLGSLVVTGLSYLVFAQAGSLAMLFASRILAGIAGAAISTAQAYVADTTEPSRRTQGMGLIYAAFGAGFIFGPAIGGTLSRFGYAVPGYAAAGLAFLAAALALGLLPESLTREKRLEAASRPLARLSPVRVFRRPVIGPAIGLFFISTLCFAAMEATFAIYGERKFRLGPQEVGYLMAFVGVVAATLQAGAVGALARRFGEGALVRAGVLVMGLGLVVMGVAPLFPLLVIAMGIVAVGSSLSGPSLAGLVSFAAGSEEQGAVLGVYASMGSLARAVGPLLGGLAFDHIAPSSPMWIGGAVVALSAWLAFRLPRSIAEAAPSE